MMVTPTRTVLATIITICLACSEANEDFDGQVTLQVQHSFDNGPDPQFKTRGAITIRSLRSGVASYTSDSQLLADDRAQLKELVQENGIYRLRVSTKLGDESSQFVSTFIKACSLYESLLSDTITLTMDQSGEVMGVSLTTNSMLCQGVEYSDSQLSSFNTTVEVQQMENGPVPDTASYIQKMEREKADKVKGEQSDNRSFFAKYWMYIVPVFIFLLVSGSATPEGAQGGGGGR